MRLYLRVDGELGANGVIMTLPEGLRPPVSVFCVAEISRAPTGASSLTHGDVTSDGYVMVPADLRVGDMILIWGSWPVVPRGGA